MNDLPYKYLKASGSSTNCSNAAFGDPTPGLAKQCFCDADSTYNQTDIDTDMKKFKALADKATAEAQATKAQNDAKNAESDKKAAEASSKAASERADKDKTSKIAQAYAVEKAAKEKAAKEAKEARAKAFEQKKIDMDKAQAAELKASKLKHEAEMSRIKALKAKRDAKHATAVDRAKALLDAYKAKVIAD